ncbi:hypothetical protein E3N88_10812 [Mikania micrantha]|uniref:Pterin-binding domain-containing protein n=1 Tax=Mikania micrantha TaxID=192012 RepID=A0A5N6PBL0_9ASTR|nr:hypothetical protein E3N88_10812 [Mikania micrantha]
MTPTIVLASGSFIQSTEFSKRLSLIRPVISGKRAVVGLRRRPSSTASCQPRRKFSVSCLQPGNHTPPTDEVDTVVEETEKIVDRIEEVAETVDKVAKDVAEHLPDGGKLKNAVVFVEGVAEEIAREAHLVEDFLHEVEEVEEKASLLVESVKDPKKHVDQEFKTS